MYVAQKRAYKHYTQLNITKMFMMARTLAEKIEISKTQVTVIINNKY